MIRTETKTRAYAPNIVIYSEAFCPLSETFVYRMATSLANCQVTILTHQRMNESAFPTAGLKIVEVPSKVAQRPKRVVKTALNWVKFRLPTAALIGTPILQSLNERCCIDLVFAHFGTCGIRILPACEKLNLPLVTMLHGCDMGSWLASWSYRNSLKRLFSRGRMFVVATDFMRRRAMSLGCEDRKLHVIPECPVPAEGREANIESVRTSEDVTTFLHVGRLHEQKGILFSIRAFAIVHRSIRRTRFVIIGDGPQREQAEELVRDLQLEPSVFFKGALPFSAVSENLRAADVYVIHSMTTPSGDTEGFGVSLAEASGAGLPVVATRHNGFPEVVLHGETGMLVDEGDVEGMAAAMMSLARSPALRACMGNAGTRYMRERFSLDAISSKYAELFEAVQVHHSSSR